MKLTRLSILILILTSCFRISETSKDSVTKPQPLPNAVTELVLKNKTEEILTKAQRESIYFSAQLEKEALKLLLKNPSFSELTLFSVLSYAVDNFNGLKRSPPGRLDCSRFRLQPLAGNKRLIQVFQTCQKPENLIAQIDLGLSSSSMTVTFFLKEWVRVVGLSVTLTGANTVCDFESAANKLEKLDCKDWAYTVSTSAVSSEELRLKEFLFQRHQPNQFTLKGGRFVDLVERKKFAIQIPMEGKIKIFEKEMKVIDEFAERTELEASPPVKRIEIKGVPIEENAQEGSLSPKEDNTEKIPQEEATGENEQSGSGR